MATQQKAMGRLQTFTTSLTDSGIS